MKYFTIAELTRSATAQKLYLRNWPDTLEEEVAVTDNLHYLVDHVLDPLREAFGLPIVVTSGYRHPILNYAVGGAPNSAHMKGLAADIRGELCQGRAINKRLLAAVTTAGCDYDQLIIYNDGAEGPTRLHISIAPPGTPNRHQLLSR